jgi:hypothetical protein
MLMPPVVKPPVVLSANDNEDTPGLMFCTCGGPGNDEIATVGGI